MQKEDKFNRDFNGEYCGWNCLHLEVDDQRFGYCEVYDEKISIDNWGDRDGRRIKPCRCEKCKRDIKPNPSTRFQREVISMLKEILRILKERG